MGANATGRSFGRIIGILSSLRSNQRRKSAPDGAFPLIFYQRKAEDVARDLIGKTLVRTWRGRELRARLIEIEAYVGPHDLASHSSRGRTPRTEIMFGPGGHAYVYFIYGMHEMLNIVTSHEGDAQ